MTPNDFYILGDRTIDSGKYIKFKYICVLIYLVTNLAGAVLSIYYIAANNKTCYNSYNSLTIVSYQFAILGGDYIMGTVLKTERKVTRIGNSLGITFPGKILKKINIVQGDEVTIDVRGDEIILRKSRKIQLPRGISRDFLDIINETMIEYDATIKELRDK